MDILGLIPARGNSKGVPHKNKRLLQGKPLIAYSIETALESGFLSSLVVSTDDEEIARISKNWNAEVPFIRPSELAADTAPTIDTVIHALRFFEQKGRRFGAVCLLQPTVPFRSAIDIDEAIKTFLEKGADSLISVREIPHIYNPHWAFEPSLTTGFLNLATGEKDIISRRQALPRAYHRDGAIYITKSEIVLKKHSLYGEKICHFECKGTPDINIDTENDWQEAETFLKGED